MYLSTSTPATARSFTATNLRKALATTSASWQSTLRGRDRGAPRSAPYRDSEGRLVSTATGDGAPRCRESLDSLACGSDQSPTTMEYLGRSSTLAGPSVPSRQTLLSRRSTPCGSPAQRLGRVLVVPTLSPHPPANYSPSFERGPLSSTSRVVEVLCRDIHQLRHRRSTTTSRDDAISTIVLRRRLVSVALTRWRSRVRVPSGPKAGGSSPRTTASPAEVRQLWRARHRNRRVLADGDLHGTPCRLCVHGPG